MSDPKSIDRETVISNMLGQLMVNLQKRTGTTFSLVYREEHKVRDESKFFEITVRSGDFKEG